jgi:hypothetical protein
LQRVEPNEQHAEDVEQDVGGIGGGEQCPSTEAKQTRHREDDVGAYRKQMRHPDQLCTCCGDTDPDGEAYCSSTHCTDGCSIDYVAYQIPVGRCARREAEDAPDETSDRYALGEQVREGRKHHRILGSPIAPGWPYAPLTPLLH